MVFVMGLGPHCRHLQLVGLVNTMHGGGTTCLPVWRTFVGPLGVNWHYIVEEASSVSLIIIIIIIIVVILS